MPRHSSRLASASTKHPTPLKHSRVAPTRSRWWSSMDVDAARVLFPGATEQRYFATNGYGLLSTPARDAIVAAAEGLAARGYAANHRLERAIDDTRAKVGALVGAQPAEIGFTRNTADGLIYAAESFPWQPGDE